MSLSSILGTLRSLHLHPQGLEYEIQDRIAESLTIHGVSFRREYRLGSRNRVDFLCPDGIAIEVKKGKPASAALTAQAERYAAFEVISTIILVVERCVFDAPETVNGKPVHYIALAKNWGIAL